MKKEIKKYLNKVLKQNNLEIQDDLTIDDLVQDFINQTKLDESSLQQQIEDYVDEIADDCLYYKD